jgi:hypothetical protein
MTSIEIRLPIPLVSSGSKINQLNHLTVDNSALAVKNALRNTSRCASLKVTTQCLV